MKSLTEAAKAVLEGTITEGAPLPTVGSLSGGVSNPDPVDPSTASTGNAKTLRPSSRYKEEKRRPQNGAGAPDESSFSGVDDLGGQTPTSLPAGNLGAASAKGVGKDSTRSSKSSVAAEPMKKLAEDEYVDGDVVEEDVEISEELEDFINEGIAAGLSEEEILAAIDENFEFIDEESHCKDEDEKDEDEKEDKKKKMEEALEDYQIDMSEHVDALLAGENLSEEFHAKATTIFEAAVKSKLEEEVALLEQAYAETLEERVSEIMEQLSTDVDNYLNYVVEQWIEENEVAIESALRSELTEDFISGLRSLFAEHYIDIPEEEVHVVEELSQTVEELEEKLNEEIERNVTLTSALNESRKYELVSAVCEGLTATQAEKLKGLAENVDYTSDEEFVEKISTLRENYLPTAFNNEEVLDRAESQDPKMISESTLEGPMSRYVQALGRSLPK